MARRAVLIVEGHPQVRAVLRQIFETAGYACELADDGRKALEVFKARRAPLVVTDLAACHETAPLKRRGPETVLSHEVGHLFGAFHPAISVDSVMSSSGGP